MEQEQEYIVNKLRKQLDSLRAQQPGQSPSRSVSDIAGSTPGSIPVSPVVTGSGTSPSLGGSKKWISPHSTGAPVEGPPTGLIEVLRAEIAALKNKTAEMQKECKIRLRIYCKQANNISVSYEQSSAMQQIQERVDSIPETKQYASR